MTFDLTSYSRDVIEHGLYGAARERMLIDYVDGKPWGAKLDQAVVTFDGKAHPAQILGTHSAGDDTFLWAWANPGARSWGPSLVAANSLRALGEKSGYDVFRERKIPGDAVSLQELAWVAAELAGGHAVYFAAAGGGTTAVMLIADGPTEMAKLPLAYAPGVLLAFQPVTGQPMVACAKRFLERLGFAVNEERSKLSGQRADGSGATLTFDDQGRLSQIEMGVHPAR